MDRLFELFPDKYPALVAESASDWTFQLGWPRHLLEPIDPLLPERGACFGLDLPELDQYVEIRSYRGIPFVFSMFHSQALLAPSLAMHGNRQLPQIVVHVDAHHDLSASLLGEASPGTLVNEQFNIECRLDNPETVDHAVDAGFVNKASFLTAYFLATTARVLHVDRGCVPGKFLLKPTVQPIKIGDVLSAQQTFAMTRVAAGDTWDLLELPELPDDLHQLAGQRTWLDVDLDAFCNRFDGDSDNRDKVGSSEERSIMLEHLRGFLRDLAAVPWLVDISAVSVAASPGFFPSEYWEASIPIVCDGIAKLL